MMADPTHPQRDDWLRIEQFDPEVFDLDAVNAELRARFHQKQAEERRGRGAEGKRGKGQTRGVV
jgi:hypothetical protein